MGSSANEETTLTFRLYGLDCADCALTVEEAVRRLGGVSHARVNYATARLEARFNPRLVSPEAISHTVQASGYTARPEGVLEEATGGLSLVRPRRDLLTGLSGLSLLAAWIGIPLGAPEPIRVAFYLLAIILGGYHVARSGITAVRAHRALDMNVLMTLAAMGAMLIGEWAEGAVTMFLFSLGNTLEGYTMDRARSYIRALMDLSPAVALLRRDGKEVRTPVDQLQVGDVIVVKPGERVPVDGVILEGHSALNEAPLTGESVPADKGPGDMVYAGTINGAGALEVRVTRPAYDTTLARIIHLVEEAQAQKAPAQRFVDRFARYYTPAVILVAAAIVVLPPLLMGQPLGPWFYRGLVLMVIACPCALVLSTPVSIVAAISNAARRGVLIKGGAYLEMAGSLRVMAFDKTGTLTVGKPLVTDVVPFNGHASEEVLALAAAVESRSEHPLAQAILHEARHRGLAIPAISDFHAVAGRGARARVNGQVYTIGTRETLPNRRWLSDEAEDTLRRLEEQGKTAMVLSNEWELIGVVAVADELRPEAREAVADLRAAGIEHIAMLTGDNPVTAQAIAGRLGVDDVRAGLLPEDKVEAVRDLLRRFGEVGMVGDGVNDAPALASATVGVAIVGGGATGSDAALETADIVLMSGDLSRLPFAIRLSRRARRTIRHNIAFSLAVKGVFVLLAVAGLATLWMAVLADMGASLLVILNGMRLLSCEG